MKNPSHALLPAFSSAFLLMAVLLNACGIYETKDQGSSTHRLNNGNTLLITPTTQLSYAQVRDNVFLQSCAECHMNGEDRGDVSLDTYPDVISNLNEIKSTVFEGNPKPMPRGGLAEDQKAILRQWIAQGAREFVAENAASRAAAQADPSPATPSANPVPLPSPVDTSPTPAPTLIPTFTSLRELVFKNKCIQCHAAGQEQAKRPLDDYARMLAARKFVIPGDAEGSKLVREIEKGSMPPEEENIPAVTPGELTVIRTWIANGAPE